MAITAQTRTDLVQLVVSMLGEAPSTAMLTDLVNKANAGSTIQELADDLAGNAAFASNFPVWMTAKEFTAKITTQMFAGSSVSTADYDAAVDYIAGAITAGTFTKTSAVVALTSYLASEDGLANATYGSAAQSYQNKVEVAEYYTITKGLGDATADERKAAIAAVTSEATTVTESQASADAEAVAAAVIPGKTFTLTNSSNQLTGGADNIKGSTAGDTILATADAALSNGDVVDGGLGSDTLTARYSVAADTTINSSVTGVETIILDTDEGAAADHELNFGANFVGLERIHVRDHVATDAAGTDDINITSIALGVEIGLVRGATAANGTPTVDVDFQYAGTTGLTDAATLYLDSGQGETVTVAGIETLTLNAASGVSRINLLTATSAANVTVTGAGRLTVSDIDDASDVIDASAATGVVSISGIGNGNATLLKNTITAGSGGNTFDMGANLNGFDVVTGGAGTDRLKVNTDETTKIAGLTAFEEIELEIADADIANAGGADGTGTVALSGLVSADVTRFVVDVNTAADDDTVVVNVTSLDDGDTVTLADGASDTTSGGLTLNTAPASDTTSNTLTVELDFIGALSADASTGAGINQIEVDEIETLTIQADNFGTTLVENGVGDILAASASTINVTGGGRVTVAAITNTTKLTKIDASANTNNVSITGIDASVLTYTGGAGNDVISLAGVTNADSFDGGAGTGDSLTATGVTGRTATTGALSVTDFETVIVQASGANTFDVSGLSGVTSFDISGATPGNQTVTGIPASGITFGIGEKAGSGVVLDASDKLTLTLADATGAADAVSVDVHNEASTGTDTKLIVKDVETLNISMQAAQTNNAQVLMSDMEAPTINVTGGAAGALLTMGTLDPKTTALNANGSGEVSFTAATTTESFTFTSAGALAAADDITLGAGADTSTVAATGAVDVDIDSGAGTDTLNLTVATGFVDTGEIDNTEALNITVVPGVDINIGANGTAATDANGIEDATKVTLLGGNSLSTVEIGDSAAASADQINAAVDIDATGFLGNVFLEYGADVLTATTDVDAGALTTDRVYAKFDTTNTDIVLPFTGVETFTALVNSGNTAAQEQYNFDVDSATGLAKIELASLPTNQDALVDIDDYEGQNIQLGLLVAGAVAPYHRSSEVDINHKVAAGYDDAATVTLVDTDAAAGTIDIDSAGTETLTLALNTTGTESHRLNLAGVTPTALGTTTINVAGGVAGQTLTLSAIGAGTATINAATNLHNLVLSARPATAMTITTGIGADQLIMANAADVITAGTGADTLTINKNAILGGLQVNLASTTDQVTTFNGSANTAAQTGFTSVNVSGVTGSFGADITANKVGGTITGTGNADQITGGAGVDTILGGAGNDVITAGAGADEITGGTGNDDVTLGTGAEDYNIAANGNAAGSVLTAENITETGVIATETITFGNGVDIIRGFQTGAGGDSIDGANAGNATTAVGVDVRINNATTTYYLDGDYNEATGVFTGATTGADALIYQGAAGADLSAVDTFVVLIGVDHATFHADNFT